MAETFKVGANARELLRYTQRATRIVTDDISRSDARKIIQKVAALEDVRDIQKVCGTAVHALDTRDREGFSKSTCRPRPAHTPGVALAPICRSARWGG